MSGLAAFSILVAVLMLLACVAAFPELRQWSIPRWRLAVPSLLIAAATLVLLYLPPSNDLREPQVWMMALVAAVLGLARGALIGLQVDQASGRLLLRGRPRASGSQSSRPFSWSAICSPSRSAMPGPRSTRPSSWCWRSWRAS